MIEEYDKGHIASQTLAPREGACLGDTIGHSTLARHRRTAAGIGFRSLTEALDTTTAQGRLIFHMFGALPALAFAA